MPTARRWIWGWRSTFPAPASFTGEHVLQLQGHGGAVVLRLLVELRGATWVRAARCPVSSANARI
jgi:tRNA U34 5-carboxymethylaminomethyl modifying GTPase MnmE/TrmE